KEDGIFLSQDKYVGDILKKFRYSDVRSSNTPMDKENHWGKEGTRKDVDLYLYRSMIGSLMYLTASRPDIMFAVFACARHQVTPKECHLHAVKRIFRYLKGHPKLRLWYPKESPFDFVAYLDSDDGGATQDRKSTIGGCQFLGRGLISWQCKKQTIVATSTTEAEYVVAAILPPIADEPASPLRHFSQGEACPTDSGFKADQDSANIAKTSTLPSDSTPRVTSLAADEGSMQQKLDELMALCTSLQRQHSVMVSKFEAQELKINSLKGRRLDEREEAAERVSDDTEEMATILTSIDAASILTSGGVQVVPTTAEVATVTISIPTGSGVVTTASPTIPTAALIFTTATESTPYTRRKGKETMVESETPKKKKVQKHIDVQLARELEEEMIRDTQRMNEQVARDAEIARIHAEEELQMLIDGLDWNNETVVKYLQEYYQFAAEFPIERRIELISDLVKYQDNYAKVINHQTQQRKHLTRKQQREFYTSVLRNQVGWKAKHFKGMTLEEIKEKFDPVWKQIQDFIPISSKEEAEKFKRKGLRLEQESVKKVKTSEEVKATEEVPEEKILIKETSINIDALYNILKQNQGDVNDALGYKKKDVVINLDPLALVAEKTKMSKRKEKVVVSSDSKVDKKEDTKADEKKRDMRKVKCYNCKKEGHFAKDCKKAKIKDYNYYKKKMLLAKNDSDEQVLLAEDQAWMESSSDSNQEINANMVFMEKIEKVLSESDESSLSAEETIAELAYYTSESESKYEFKTSEYYDNSTNYGLFINNNNDQEIFHDAIKFASENFFENHIDSQKDYDKSKVDHNDSKEKGHLVDKLIRKFNHKIAKCQKRIEKANQQSKDFKNQNKDLQEKYDVLINQVNTFEEQNNEFNTVHMIVPSKDILYNGRKGIGFENPRYFEKEKDLRPSLYDEKVIGLGYTLMFLTHSDEALEIEKFKRSRENKIKFAYDYGNLNASYVNEKINFLDDYFHGIINPDFETIDSLFQQTSSLKPYVPNVILEKIIIDLKDEVVSLLEKEKENLKTIDSLKSKCFELSENAISESKNQSENDCNVVGKECDKVENSKEIAPGLFKLNLDTFSSVRRPKNSGVIWKKKGSSNTSNVDLSAISLSRMCDLFDDNNFFILDDESVRISPVSKMPIRKKPHDSMNVRSKSLPKMEFKKDHLCSACEQGMIHRKHHKSKMAFASNKPLYLLHMDLCEPMRIESINRKRNVLVVVDDYSRYTWVFFLHSKDEASEVIISFIKKTQVNLQLQVQCVRTDNSTKFKNKTLAKFFDEVGITQQFSAARMPQQNGVV
nr:hypothetical protein [Tanacetum cinerariifolium]